MIQFSKPRLSTEKLIKATAGRQRARHHKNWFTGVLPSTLITYPDFQHRRSPQRKLNENASNRRTTQNDHLKLPTFRNFIATSISFNIPQSADATDTRFSYTGNGLKPTLTSHDVGVARRGTAPGYLERNILRKWYRSWGGRRLMSDNNSCPLLIRNHGASERTVRLQHTTSSKLWPLNTNAVSGFFSGPWYFFFNFWMCKRRKARAAPVPSTRPFRFPRRLHTPAFRVYKRSASRL